ncbi:MAG TPA: DUF1223 domain-containing protein [Puia sp.]|jgi:hypothetical protein|nr:DUF1223 domain-containing protein [Puia sp.]
MNTSRIVGLLIGLVIVVLAAQAFNPFGHRDPSARPGDPAKGFAVVELFTSEGCSSCPPADQLIARVQQESKDQPVYILAFHVDYWDRSGWKDAFSDASYTRRQNQYAAWLKLQSIYTPQVVVNGSKEFVGSQETTLRNTIKDDLQEASPAMLTLSNVRLNKGKVDWQCRAQNAGNNNSLILVMVQRSATTRVKAGENSGRTLSHVQIVRQLQTVELHSGSSGAGSLILPAGIDTRDEEIIAFLQNNDNGRIMAATRSALP